MVEDHFPERVPGGEEVKISRTSTIV